MPTLTPSWKAFLRVHWPAIAACDFFTVEVLTWTSITRFYVMFVIALQTLIDRLPRRLGRLYHRPAA